MSFTLNGSQTWTNNSSSLLLFNASTANVTAGPTNIAMGANTLTISGTGNTTINDVITGSSAGGITKSGAGTLILGGNATAGGNTYTGTTTIAGGILQSNFADNVGVAGALGNGGNITFTGGTLQYTAASAATDYATRFKNSTSAIILDTNAQSVTLAGSIGATNIGGLTKSGSGNLTLSAVNSYTGGTVVDAGKLVLSGSGTLGSTANALTVSGNGVLDLGATSQTVGLVTFNGTGTTQNGTLTGTHYEGLNGTVSVGLAGSGVALTKNGTGALTVNGNATYTGGTTVNAGNLTFAGNNTFGAGGFTVNNGATLYMGSTSTSNNSYTGNTTINNGGTLKIGSNGALGVSTVTINDGAIINHTSAHSLDNALVFNGNFTYTGAALWNQNGIVTLQANTVWNVSDAAAGVFNLNSGGVIGQNGGVFSITKTGAGKVTLGAVNTFGGGFILNDGTVNVNNAKGLGTGMFTINGGSFDNSSASASLTWTNNNSITVNGDFTYVGTNATNTGSGVVSLGSGVGTARQITVTASTLTMGGNISNGSTGNSIIKAGAGTLTLSGNNSFTGGIVVNAGLLGAGSNNAWGTGNVTFSGGSIDLSGVTLQNDIIFASNAASSNVLSAKQVFNGTISGTGTWGYNGFSQGSVTFNADNSGWSGNISLSGAAMRLGQATSAGTGKIIITNVLGLQSMSSGADLSGGAGVANTLDANQGFAFYLDNSLKYSGVIQNNTALATPIGSIRLNSGSTGTLYLTANNTYTGFTNIQGSTLEVTAIGNGGEGRNIGASTSNATNLIIGGNGNSTGTSGVLRYVGTGETTDRLFTIGSASTAYNIYTGAGSAPVVDLNATVNSKIDSSGAGALVFGNAGSLLVGNALNTVFELSGSNTGNNTIAAVIGNTSAHTPITRANSTTQSGTTGGGNRQIQVTDTTGIMVGDIVTGDGITGNSTVGVVLGPTRLVLVTGATGNFTANGTLVFTNPDVASNKTSLLKSGAGTWVLSGTNAYTGNTTITGGTLQIGAGGSAGSLSTASAISNNATLAFNRSDTVTQGTHFASVISGTGNVTQSGTGTLDLSGTNTFTGAAIVNAGTMLVSGTINTSSGVTVNAGTFNYSNNGTGLTRSVTVNNGGTFRYNSTSVFGGSLALNSGSTLGGEGNLGTTAVVIGSGVTISPGNSPGTLATGAETWDGGGTYVWEINDATGSQGTNWDFLSISGALNISSLTSGNQFTISLVGLNGSNVSGAVQNWNSATDNQSWWIASFGSLTGTFDPNLFNVNTSGFTNNNSMAPGSSFSVVNVGNDLYLSYAVPEPAAWILAAFGLTTAVVFRRRRRD